MLTIPQIILILFILPPFLLMGITDKISYLLFYLHSHTHCSLYAAEQFEALCIAKIVKQNKLIQKQTAVLQVQEPVQ